MTKILELFPSKALAHVARRPVPSPSPEPAAITLDRVPELRSLYCTEYDGCLAAAIRRGWDGWSCTGCELFHLDGNLRSAFARHRASQRRSPWLEEPATICLDR